MLIVFCEECGKKYTVDPQKIKGAEIKFKCKSCGHIIHFSRPAPVEEKPPSTTPGGSADAADEPPEKVSTQAGLQEKKASTTSFSLKKPRYGLLHRMVVTCILVPVVLAFISGFFCHYRLDRLSSELAQPQVRKQNLTGQNANLPAALGAYQHKAADAIEQVQSQQAWVWTLTMLLIIASVTAYCYRLIEKIKCVAEAAESISLGALDAKLELKSNDEVGKIGESINRLQDSVVLAIERLRR